MASDKKRCDELRVIGKIKKMGQESLVTDRFEDLDETLIILAETRGLDMGKCHDHGDCVPSPDGECPDNFMLDKRDPLPCRNTHCWFYESVEESCCSKHHISIPELLLSCNHKQ